jgi:hypothetical protein
MMKTSLKGLWFLLSRGKHTHPPFITLHRINFEKEKKKKKKKLTKRSAQGTLADTVATHHANAGANVHPQVNVFQQNAFRAIP